MSVICFIGLSQLIWLVVHLLVMALLEVSRHDVFGKLMRLVDAEGFAMWLPRDNVFVPIDDCFLQHFVELEREWKLNEEQNKSCFV